MLPKDLDKTGMIKPEMKLSILNLYKNLIHSGKNKEEAYTTSTSFLNDDAADVKSLALENLRWLYVNKHVTGEKLIKHVQSLIGSNEAMIRAESFEVFREFIRRRIYLDEVYSSAVTELESQKSEHKANGIRLFSLLVPADHKLPEAVEIFIKYAHMQTPIIRSACFDLLVQLLAQKKGDNILTKASSLVASSKRIDVLQGLGVFELLYHASFVTSKAYDAAKKVKVWARGWNLKPDNQMIDRADKLENYEERFVSKPDYYVVPMGSEDDSL